MNLKLFQKRLISFYACWMKQKRDLWGNADILVIGTPPSDSHPISSLFFVWLMGHDFPDTTVLFTKRHIYFLCPKRKSAVLQTLAGAVTEALEADVTVHPKGKGDNGLELMDAIIRGVRVSYEAKIADKNWCSPRPLVVGYISGECPKSKLIWGCINNMKPKDFRSAHVTGFTRMLSHDQESKDGSELFEGPPSLSPPERKPKARGGEDRDKKVQSEKEEKGNRPVRPVIREEAGSRIALSEKEEEVNPPVMQDMTQAEEVEKSSGEYSLVSAVSGRGSDEDEEDEDDWVLLI